VVVVSWLILLVIVILGWIVFDPLGKSARDGEDDMGALTSAISSHVHQSVWEGRFKTLMCCLYNRKDQSTVKAFRQIAGNPSLLLHLKRNEEVLFVRRKK
jgi:hypothetical protein